MFSIFKPKKNPRLPRLKTVKLFENLSYKELEIVDQMLHERTYLKNEFVFDQGDEGQALFIVLAGKIRTRRVDAPKEPEVDFYPGSFFGELALLEESPRSAEARAIEDSQMVALFRTDFLSLLQTETAIASKISYALAKNLAGHLRRIMTSPQEMNSL